MKLIITNQPEHEKDGKIADATRAYSAQFVIEDWSPLSVYINDEGDELIAGLTGKIFGNWLHIYFL